MTDPTPCPFHEFNAGVARARHAYEENPTIGSRLCGICARWLGDDRHRICRGCRGRQK